MMWNLLAGYGGMVSIGQQAYFGFGGYVMLMLGNVLGLKPFIAIAPGVLCRVQACGRLLRDRHLGHRRGVWPELRQRVGGG